MGKAVHGKLKEQIKDVDNVQSKEVPIFWSGMAEVNILSHGHGMGVRNYQQKMKT